MNDSYCGVTVKYGHKTQSNKLTFLKKKNECICRLILLIMKKMKASVPLTENP